jgi:lysophospholipase L1-like esterase
MKSLRFLPLFFLAAACLSGLAETPAANEVALDTLVPVAPPAEEAAPRATAVGDATAPLSPIVRGTTIIAVGSSTTYGLDASHDTHATYLEQFCRLPGIAGRVGLTDNQGVSGAGLDSAVDHYANGWTDVNKVAHRPVKSFAPKATGIPAWIFLWIGSNDFPQANFELPAYLTKYKAYIAQAHADGFKVAIATLTPRGDNVNALPVPDAAILREPNRLALNRALSRLDPFYDGAACPDVVVRLDQVLNDAADQGWDPATRSLYGLGFLHPRQLGYYWVARAWYQALVLGGSPYTPGVALVTQPNDFRQPQTFQPIEMVCPSGAGWYRVASFDDGAPRAQTPKHFHVAAYTDDNKARNNFELIVAGCDGLTGTLNGTMTVLNAKTMFSSAPLATQARISTDTEHRVELDLYLAQSGRVALLQDSDAIVARNPAFNPPVLNNAATLAIPATGFASNGGIAGTTTGGNASPGAVGEYLSATLPAAQAVTLADGTVAEVARLDLPAGDWDVTGVVDFHGSGAAPVYLQAGSSSVPTALGSQDTYCSEAGGAAMPVDAAKAIPTVRYSLNAPATVYLVAKAGFPAASLSAYGTLRARRMR